MLVSIDGPSGIGKSTVIGSLVAKLRTEGHSVHTTAEPSNGPIGRLSRQLTDSITGHALACLYAADRYHHLDTEIRPALEAGQIVITDRYVPSGLVMQRLDGVPAEFLWRLNEHALRPDLAVILEAESEVIADRLRRRGPHNRLQRTPESSHEEARFYQQAAAAMTEAGFALLRVNADHRTPDELASLIFARVTSDPRCSENG